MSTAIPYVRGPRRSTGPLLGAVLLQAKSDCWRPFRSENLALHPSSTRLAICVPFIGSRLSRHPPSVLEDESTCASISQPSTTGRSSVRNSEGLTNRGAPVAALAQKFRCNLLPVKCALPKIATPAKTLRGVGLSPAYLSEQRGNKTEVPEPDTANGSLMMERREATAPKNNQDQGVESVLRGGLGKVYAWWLQRCPTVGAAVMVRPCLGNDDVRSRASAIPSIRYARLASRNGRVGGPLFERARHPRVATYRTTVCCS
ncbi:hypothetical protein BJ546DRAFT_588282 [Cryomyces antarcticus]